MLNNIKTIKLMAIVSLITTIIVLASTGLVAVFACQNDNEVNCENYETASSTEDNSCYRKRSSNNYYTYIYAQETTEPVNYGYCRGNKYTDTYIGVYEVTTEPVTTEVETTTVVSTTTSNETTTTSTTPVSTVTSQVTTTTAETSVTTSVTKSNEEIAADVIRGNWGNGSIRKRLLKDAGYNYSEIQSIVNEMIISGRRSKTITTESNKSNTNAFVKNNTSFTKRVRYTVENEGIEVTADNVTDFYENVDTTTSSSSISDSDFILICNCVAHEAGNNWISTYNKALVVEVIMNRVYSSKYPDTVYGVITQKGQFSGCWNYANLSSYSSKVSDDVIAAVNMYFDNPSDFNHGYYGFWGDGKQNHFR